MLVRRQSVGLVGLVAVLAAGLALTACAEGPDEAAPSVDEALAAKVPADIAADGKIVIGTSVEPSPDESSEIVSMDADLGKAIAAILGLTARFVNWPFDGIIPGVKSGMFELGMASLTDTAKREKDVDMVTYFSAGNSLAVRRGNELRLTVDTLCGRTVAVLRGTIQVDDLTARSLKCQAEGKPPVMIAQFGLQSEVDRALISGRADALLSDTPVVDYDVQISEGQIEKVGDSYDEAPYGIAVPKGKGEFARAVQGAVQALIDDGTYARILERWGFQAGAIPTSEINAAEA